MENKNNRIGALWIKEGRKGKFMSGNVEIDGVKVDIVVFKNDKGDNPKRPDYSILKSEPRGESKPYVQPGSPADDHRNGFDDDIPFNTPF